MQALKYIIVASVIVAVSMGLAKLPDSRRHDPIVVLERQVNLTKSKIRLGAEHVKMIAKIERIISRFNSNMSEQQRNTIAREICRMSIKYPNLDTDLICATITHESARTWHPKIVSPAGALGLMQIMPRTGKWLAQYEGIKWTDARDVLFDPISNIRLGSRYLSALIETFDVEGGLAAYNGGSKRVRRWLANNKSEKMLYRETRLYVPFVLKLYDEFVDM